MKSVLMACSIPLFVWTISCHRVDTGKVGINPPEAEKSVEADSEIVLSQDQFESMGMELGTPVLKQFSNSVNANGYIISTPSGSASISTLIAGRVRQIAHSPGDHVKKGELLFSLEGNEIISLQQEYAEAFHQLTVLKADYDRLRTLSGENVVARKEFLKTEGEYGIMTARAKGLKARLELVNIDPASVERGDLVPYLTVSSPISGTVIDQKMELGQYIEPQETVLEVMDPAKMQLSLQIFEKDLADVAIGQQVIFFKPDNREMEFYARISHMGISIEPDTRVVRCLAKIKPVGQGPFMNNLFVESRIITSERQALALPEEALIKEGNISYVLVFQEEEAGQMRFKKVPVQIGVTGQGFTEVLDANLQNILVKGAYNLWSTD